MLFHKSGGTPRENQSSLPPVSLSPPPTFPLLFCPQLAFPLALRPSFNPLPSLPPALFHSEEAKTLFRWCTFLPLPHFRNSPAYDLPARPLTSSDSNHTTTSLNSCIVSIYDVVPTFPPDFPTPLFLNLLSLALPPFYLHSPTRTWMTAMSRVSWMSRERTTARSVRITLILLPPSFPFDLILLPPSFPFELLFPCLPFLSSFCALLVSLFTGLLI